MCLVGNGRDQQEWSLSSPADRHNPESPPSYDPEASPVPLTNPSDEPCDAGSNPDTWTNDKFDQLDSPEDPIDSRPHEDSPHSISQALVPEPTAGKHAEVSEERGPVGQQHGTDAPISTLFSRTRRNKPSEDRT